MTIKVFREKLQEQLNKSSTLLFEELKPYRLIKVESERAAFVEVNFSYQVLTWEGFPGSLNLIYKGNEVEDLLTFAGLETEIFPMFKEKHLLTDELTENEEIGLETEDIVMDEIAKWFSKVWKQVKPKLNIPIFVTQEDPISWFDIQEEKWTKQPFPNDEEGNWVTS